MTCMCIRLHTHAVPKRCLIARPQDELPLLAEVFRLNFPGMDVEALDREDPKLKQYMDELKEANEDVSAARPQRKKSSLKTTIEQLTQDLSSFMSR